MIGPEVEHFIGDAKSASALGFLFNITGLGELTTGPNPLLKKFLKFLPDALAARGRSKDRSTKVGAVVIDDDFNVRISGYNGFPRGVNDDIDARHARPAKYDWSAHSEENCVAQAARVGVSLMGCTILLTSLFPCTGCSRMIIQSGIKRVVAPRQKDEGVGGADRTDWNEKETIALEMLAEAGVEVLYYEVPPCSNT